MRGCRFSIFFLSSTRKILESRLKPDFRRLSSSREHLLRLRGEEEEEEEAGGGGRKGGGRMEEIGVMIV